MFYEDEISVAFLNKYPPLYGYSLVAPKQHREQVTGDFAAKEYLALQDVVYRVGEALRRTVSTERLYISVSEASKRTATFTGISLRFAGDPLSRAAVRGVEPTGISGHQRG